MKESKKEPFCVYMTYTEDREGGEVCAGQENDSWPDYEPTTIAFAPIGLFVEPNQWCETIEIGFDPSNKINEYLFVLIVRYQDGDTFGYTSGYWRVEGIYLSTSEADKIKQKIVSGKYKKYEPWNGYFAHLENIEIHRIRLEQREG